MKPDHGLSMLVFSVNIDIMISLFLAGGASLGLIHPHKEHHMGWVRLMEVRLSYLNVLQVIVCEISRCDGKASA